jgi:glycosyltransferase involved in cell wall biosynthesis
VLFVGPNVGAGGAERQWSILLPALRERGFDARLLLLDGGGPFREPLERQGVPLEVVGMRHQADLPRLIRSRMVRGFRPGAILSRGINGLYVGQALASLRRARHLYNDHRQVGLALSPRREAMTRLIARRLDRVVVVTADQAAVWRARGYPPERVLVVANGVATPSVPESREVIRRELGLPDGAVVALVVAMLRAVKRIPDFVEAVLKARAAHPELIGLVVGEGAERPAIERAVGDTGAVRLLGERGDVPRLLKAADVFVLPSEYEAAPMAILEAMAAGLPVIATNVGGVPEIVVDRTTGLLVSPRAPAELAARLVELAADAALRARLGSAGAQRHRARWDAQVMIDSYARILDGD